MNDWHQIGLVIVMAALPAVVLLISIQWCKMDNMRDEDEAKPTKPVRPGAVVIAPEPDIRTECPACHVKKKRPMQKTKVATSGLRRGYYRCDHVDTKTGRKCRQWFCRVLSDK